MLNCSAHSLAAARSVTRSANRPALFVAASVSVQTVVIHSALNLHTRHVRVALVAGLARAHRFVLYNPTGCVFAARARIRAQLVDTAVSLSALVVCCTTGQNWRQRATARFVITNPAVRTCTDHGAYRQRVDDRTNSRTGAWAQCLTQRLAFGVETSVFGRTVLVLHTLRPRYRQTCNMWIANKSRRTSALWLVFSHQTVGVLCTWVLVQTRIDAVFVTAGLVHWTLCITPTANHLACHKRIAFVAR